jgi:type III restriction enzyme
MSYVPDKFGMFEPEYAEVYGVPFSFIPCSGSSSDPKPGPVPTRVRALADRINCEIMFPRLIGYRYELPGERLTAKFTEDSKMVISTADIPTETENAPIVGEPSMHTLYEVKNRREQEVAFKLAKVLLDEKFRDVLATSKMGHFFNRTLLDNQVAFTSSLRPWL